MILADKNQANSDDLIQKVALSADHPLHHHPHHLLLQDLLRLHLHRLPHLPVRFLNPQNQRRNLTLVLTKKNLGWIDFHLHYQLIQANSLWILRNLRISKICLFPQVLLTQHKSNKLLFKLQIHWEKIKI